MYFLSLDRDVVRVVRRVGHQGGRNSCFYLRSPLFERRRHAFPLPPNSGGIGGGGGGCQGVCVCVCVGSGRVYILRSHRSTAGSSRVNSLVFRKKKFRFINEISSCNLTERNDF